MSHPNKKFQKDVTKTVIFLLRDRAQGQRFFELRVKELMGLPLQRLAAGGSLAQSLAHLLPDPAAPGSIPSVPNVDEVYQGHCL